MNRLVWAVAGERQRELKRERPTWQGACHEEGGDAMKWKRTILRRTSTALTLAAMLLVASAGKAAGPVDTDWTSYNGTVNGQRYSPLNQITVQNVASLT